MTDRTQYWCSGCGEPLGEDEPNHQHSKTTLQPHLTAREQHRLACGTCGKRLRDHNEQSDHAFVRMTTPPPPATPPKPLGFVTLAWDATAEDVARIRRDWEAAAPDPAPLDVERLARALHRSYDRDPAVRRIEWNDLNEADRGMWRRHAAAIAREYAKEPQP